MRTLTAALALLVVVPTALAAYRDPEPLRPHLPTLAQQRRAVADVYRRHAVVSCGGGRGDAVALTFDDGPGPYTADVLGVLGAWGAVGDHTWSHPRLTQIPHWLVWLELMRTQYSVAAELGSKPVLFRVPYAMHSPSVDAVARKLGLVEVFWDVDSRDDVRNARPADIVRTVERGLRPGAIIVLHDIHPWTLTALPDILAAISRRGLRAVSVPELLALDPPSPGQRCPYGQVAA